MLAWKFEKHSLLFAGVQQEAVQELPLSLNTTCRGGAGFPPAMNKDQPAQSNRSDNPPRWLSLHCIILRSQALAWLRWTYVPLRLISSMKSSPLLSALFAFHLASSSPFSVCIHEPRTNMRCECAEIIAERIGYLKFNKRGFKGG